MNHPAAAFLGHAFGIPAELLSFTQLLRFVAVVFFWEKATRMVPEETLFWLVNSLMLTYLDGRIWKNIVQTQGKVLVCPRLEKNTTSVLNQNGSEFGKTKWYAITGSYLGFRKIDV